MLAARMPLLDSDKLSALPGCELADTYDAMVFTRCLEYVERWHATSCEGLAARLNTVSKAPPMRIVNNKTRNPLKRCSPVDAVSRNLGRNSPLSLKTDCRDRARFESEFLVGLAVALAPTEFTCSGLGRLYTPDQLALAVAKWLAEHNNAHSKEWIRSKRRVAFADAVTSDWAARYLEPSATTGMHMIDRIMRATAAVDPLSTRVRQLSAAEMGAHSI